MYARDVEFHFSKGQIWERGISQCQMMSAVVSLRARYIAK